MSGHQQDNPQPTMSFHLESLAVVEAAPLAIVVVDDDGRIVRSNAKAEEFFGYERDELAGRPLELLIPERVRDVHARHRANYFAGPRTRPMGLDLELAGRRKDGSEFPIEVGLSTIETERGTYAVAFVTDITQRREAKQWLAEERNFISAVLDTVASLVVVLDRRGRIVRFNRACERLTGYTSEEVAGKAVWDLFLLPEEVEPVKAVFDELRSGQFPNQYENYWVTRDGARRLIAWTNTVLLDENDAVAYIIATGTDVTEQRQVEVARRQYAERLETMHEMDAAILAAQSSEEVATVALTHLRRFVTCDHLDVTLFNATAGDARVLAVLGDGAGVESGTRFPLDALHTIETLRQGRSYLEPGAAGFDTINEATGEREGVTVRIPLIAHGDLIGTLMMAATDADTFEGEHVEIAREIADHLAVAIQQARLREELAQHAAKLEHRVRERTREIERRRRVAESLRATLARLNSEASLDDILQTIVIQADRLLHADAVALFQLEEPDDRLTIRAAHKIPNKYIDTVAIPIGQGAVGRAVQEQEPITIPDTAMFLTQITEFTGRNLKPYVLGLVERYRAILAVPLMVKERAFGGMVLYYDASRSFNEDEIDLTVTFANQAALAIENARLYNQVQETAMAAERSRIARDLHDSVTQTLFSASMIAQVLPRLWERNPDQGRERLAELGELTRGALAEMRTLLLELRPEALRGAPLHELLQQVTTAITGRARLPATVTLDERCDVPPEVRIAFYRIAQEALNNIVRHARARQVTVELTCRPAGIALCVRDDGVGFHPDRVGSDHLGLRTMHERAEAVDATISIDSRPDWGTEVLVTWAEREEGRA